MDSPAQASAMNSSENNSSSLGYCLKKYCSSLVASLQEGLTYVKASFIGQVLIKTSPLIFILNRMYLISFLISVSYHFYMPSPCLKTGKEDKGQKWGGSNDGGAWNSKDAGRGCWRCRSHQNQTQYVVVVIIFQLKSFVFISVHLCVCVCVCNTVWSSILSVCDFSDIIASILNVSP